ncbi:MAG: tetratricopeptide repeat protein, partial [Candidatus Kuenenia sp.]|nr:tetratricopeptide repeat protein [Candidatus Kuenenia sp.]
MRKLINSIKSLRRHGTKIILTLSLVVSFILPVYAQENLWKELHDKTTTLLQEKRYADAIKSGEDALRIAKETFPPGHISIAASMNLLGILYRTYTMYDEAEPLFNQALDI